MADANSTYYGPVDEDSGTIHLEKNYLQGSFIGAIAYGFEFALVVKIMTLMYTTRLSRRGSFMGQSAVSQRSWRTVRLRDLRPTRASTLLLYVFVLFTSNSLFVGSDLTWTQWMFIDNRNYPGGPYMWASDFVSAPLSVLNNATFVIVTWLTDALMLWRCTVLWRGTYTMPIMTIPYLMYIATIVLGVWSITMFRGLFMFRIFLAYYCLSFGLVILTTLLIILRLFLHTRLVGKQLGPGFAQKFREITTIVVESALLSAAFSVAFLATYCLNIPSQQIFLQCVPQIEAISTLLIIVRVLEGTAVDAKLNSLTSSSRPTHSKNDSGTVEFSSNAALSPRSYVTVFDPNNPGRAGTRSPPAISIREPMTSRNGSGYPWEVEGDEDSKEEVDQQQP